MWMEVLIDKDDIDVMHWLRLRKNKKTQKQDMPPSIIVRFISWKKKMLYLRQEKFWKM